MTDASRMHFDILRMQTLKANQWATEPPWFPHEIASNTCMNSIGQIPLLHPVDSGCIPITPGCDSILREARMATSSLGIFKIRLSASLRSSRRPNSSKALPRALPRALLRKCQDYWLPFQLLVRESKEHSVLLSCRLLNISLNRRC